MQNKKIQFEDDLVIVYNPDGKEIYKGLEDYEPMKRENWQYDNQNNCYKFNGYTKICLDCNIKED